MEVSNREYETLRHLFRCVEKYLNEEENDKVVYYELMAAYEKCKEHID